MYTCFNFNKCISLRWAPSISVASAWTGTLPFDYHHYMTITTITWLSPCPPQTGTLPLWSRSTTTTTWTPGLPSPWSRPPGCSQPSYPSSLYFSDGENDYESGWNGEDDEDKGFFSFTKKAILLLLKGRLCIPIWWMNFRKSFKGGEGTVCDATKNLNETDTKIFPIANSYDIQSDTYSDTNF